MPLADVRVGMQGVGRTVFKGTHIEPFDCTVIGLLEGFDFEMDMILIRITSGPVVTENFGVVGGMSGSPIYIDGKMIGALAYGWEFQNEPIAGVTPIEQMLAQYDPDHPEARAAKVRREQREKHHDELLKRANDQLKMQGAMRPVDGPLNLGDRRYAELQVVPNAADAAKLHRQRPDIGILAPVATPVYCRGLGGTGLKMMERLLEPYNLVPMQAGGAAAPPDVEASFEPGAAIAVPITTGDIEMTAIGTLTYLDDGIALGFGHPFFGFGKVEMPMGTGYIHGVIGSLASSNKLGAMLKPVGAITQDRPTCIGGTMGRLADTLPVQYSFNEVGRGGRDFSIRLVRQPNLTDLYTVILMQMAMQNVAGGYFDGVTRSSVTIQTRVAEDGQNLVIKRSNSFDSKAASDFGGNPLWDLFMTLSLLRSNPFGEADVESVKVDMEFAAARRFANIERAQAEQQTVKRGEQFDVEVFLKPYGGKTTSLTVPVQVPDNAPLGPMVVLLVGGNDAAAIRPRINPPPFPTDVPSMIHWLNDTVPNDSLVVEKIAPTFGFEMSGHQMHDIPAPIVEPLFTSTVDDMRLIPDVEEDVLPTADVVAGVAGVMVEVIGDEGQRAEGSGDDLGSIPLGPMMMPESPMMGDMVNAAARTMASLTGDLRPTPELSWTMQPPSLSSFSPAEQRLERIVAALGGSRPAAIRRLRSQGGMVWPASTASGPLPRQSQPTRRQAEDEAAPVEGDDSPPDVTDSLKLDEPPQMPTWKELEELAKGKMTAGEGEGTEEGSDGEEEDEEDKPLARPVSVWSLSTVEDFVAGRFDGSYPSGDGSVHLAPLTEVVGKPVAERTWSVLALKDGTVVTGSWGPEATIYKLGADKAVSEYYQTDDAGLVALAQLSDGALVAGGIPSGRIYRITGEGKGAVLADLEEEYIWSLQPDASGGVYAATGRNGRLYHVDAKGKADVVMQSSDRHIIDLAPAPGGGVYAATYPLGKVYKVTGDKVESIFQSSNGAVLSLAATDNGNIYVGTADSGSIYKVAADGMVGLVAEVEESHVYSMLSVGNTVYAATSGPGQLVRIDDEDTKALVYRTDEPYLLALTKVDGERLLTTVAGSGEVVQLQLKAGQRGEYLSPVHDAEMRAHWGVARWDEAVQGQARIALQTRTGNTAFPDKAWSDWSPWLTNDHGSAITSPPARYIQVRALLYAEPGETCRLDRVTVFFRTLNRPPKVTLEAPAAGTVANKTLEVSWEAEDPDEDDLHYEVFYAPVGSDEWTLIEAATEDSDETGDEDAGDEEGTTDDGGDGADTPAEDAGESGTAVGAAPFTPFGAHAMPVSSVRRFLDALPLQGGDRPPRSGKAGEAEAKSGKPETAEASSDEAEPADGGGEGGDEATDKLTESSIEWDTTEVPDGLYRLKVVAHDEIRNPDDPKVVEIVSKPVRIDNTGPTLQKPETAEGKPPAELVFAEAGTYLSSAEYRLDDGKWQALLPADGLFDSAVETLKTPALPTEAGEHTLTIRVRDSVGNLSKFQWTFTVGG